MASETVYTCDVCGKRILDEYNRLEIVLGDRSKGRADLKIDRFYDLCEDCAERFMRMFNAFKHRPKGEDHHEE